MKYVTVFRSFSSAEAHLIRSLLETAEFHPRILHELAALSMEGYSLSTGGIRVQVPEEEAEEARALIVSDADENPYAASNTDENQYGSYEDES